MTQLDQQLAELAGLKRFDAIKPGLTTTSRLLAALGNPHERFRSLHIAGTNGKGSTATFLAAMLQRQSPNKKIALYTSPYIHDFNERMQIRGKSISDQDLQELIIRTRAAVTANQLDPTFFEFSTAAAFLYFAEQEVDTAVIEVGMGGALDATNVITPIVSVITNIGFDHMEWLGQTKREIATQKAGIIKKGIPLVTAETDPDILAYFASVCQQKKSTLYPVHEHLAATVTKQSLTSQTFTTSGVINDTFTISLLGEHQITNALTALLAWHVAVQRSEKEPIPSSVKEGLRSATIPGRLEIVSEKPFILADGAHNEDGVKTLARFLDDYRHLLPEPDTLVVGAKFDKDTSALVKEITPRFARVITTQASFEPLPAEELAAQIRSRHPNARSMANLDDALTYAKAELKPNAMMLITGSLYLVGDALAILKK